MTPYGVIDLSQQLTQTFVFTWRYQVIAWTKVDFSIVKLGGIHMRNIS